MICHVPLAGENQNVKGTMSEIFGNAYVAVSSYILWSCAETNFLGQNINKKQFCNYDMTQTYCINVSVPDNNPFMLETYVPTRK